MAMALRARFMHQDSYRDHQRRAVSESVQSQNSLLSWKKKPTLQVCLEPWRSKFCLWTTIRYMWQTTPGVLATFALWYCFSRSATHLSWTGLTVRPRNGETHAGALNMSTNPLAPLQVPAAWKRCHPGVFWALSGALPLFWPGGWFSSTDLQIVGRSLLPGHLTPWTQ